MDYDGATASATSVKITRDRNVYIVLCRAYNFKKFARVELQRIGVKDLSA